MTIAYWSPNQSAVAQVETYTFSAPTGIGNTYTATVNGKSVTYASVSGDTAALVAAGLFGLLSQQTDTPPELQEVTFANSSGGVVTATAQTPGTPFANVTIGGVAAQGLVLSTGNGLANGIATAHTRTNKSPSDVADSQNWLRVTLPAPGVRALPQNGDDVVVGDTSVGMMWNLDHLVSVQFATYTRLTSFTGSVGLARYNQAGYDEWRATYFRFVGPQGSVPAGGLQMLLGSGTQRTVPALEKYNVGSQKAALTVLSGGVIHFLGVHTDNTFALVGGATLNVAAGAGEIATLSSSTMDGNTTLNIGVGVTWTAGSTLALLGGTATLDAAPAVIDARNGAQVTVTTTGLTWAGILAQGSCILTWLAGGVVTALTLATGCVLNKSVDTHALTITNSTIDGDTCQIVDPLNTITFTNPTTVRQSVSQGPFIFTGPRTVRVQ